MAGTAKPNDDILIGSKIEMTDYKILGDVSGNGSGRASNLFNGTFGKYYDDAFDWNYSGDYINIQINKPCNLYVYLATNAYDQNGVLTITPETYKEQHELTKTTGWQLYVTGLEAGTYTFANNGYNRNDTEWFFEEITTSSDGDTGKGDNTGSDTEEGGNTGDGTGEDNSGEDNTQENKGPSKVIKSTVKDAIVNNKLFQKHVTIQEESE